MKTSTKERQGDSVGICVPAAKFPDSISLSKTAFNCMYSGVAALISNAKCLAAFHIASALIFMQSQKILFSIPQKLTKPQER